ncbi:hypothetical protein FGSG_13272 [Fusarium graminearum PH-1]|uniref:hypothetical protein n=1 Tax=Gibberella zeae (strain ATCC MYA-4620 / CBS 123657 / FGSC 9075 / NRRL 31084 / PH-1) TaxID=229533 RepID=UPI00021F22A6|nr:hypothetical protein FGSG_13272 [Fusarium graminearum PH-1]ESU14377.1 hypothetical protein FGSG_13272 [Fusarium graminearum PH-1]|eukprot:XP_011319802.1 hypothetical protein FGSG_13272 [Fusarium graminearum PH-1]
MPRARQRLNLSQVHARANDAQAQARTLHNTANDCRSFGKAPRKSRYSEKLFCCWLLAFGFWNVFLQNYATANLLLIPRWNSTTISSNGRERKKDRLRRRVDESRLRVRNGESRSNGT